MYNAKRVYICNLILFGIPCHPDPSFKHGESY